MENLAFEDTQNLHQGIQQIYTLHNLDTFGVDALSIVDRLVPSNIPNFHVTHIRTRQITSIFLPSFPGFTPEIDRVIDRHFGEHPIVHHMPQTLNGAYQISDFISRKELDCFEGLYQQYLRPLGVEDQMTFFLPNVRPDNGRQIPPADPILTGFSLHRNWQNFTHRDRLVLNLLRPHLHQAYCNAQQYNKLQQNLSQLQQSTDCLGLVVVDIHGRVQSIAPQAILWLESYFSKPTCSWQLPDHLWSWIKHQLLSLTQDSEPPRACLPLRIQQAGRELTIRLVVERIGVGMQYLLLLDEQILSSSNSLQVLGLSDRETEVLYLLLQGKENKAISTQLMIRDSTVRKHLENIYRKLGVQSRTEAIAQTLVKLGFFNSLPLS